MQADTTYKVVRPNGYGIRTEHNKEGEAWHFGYVRTPDAVVIVYSEARITNITVIKNGIEHTRRLDRGFTPRRLVTLAAQFAKEVFHD